MPNPSGWRGYTGLYIAYVLPRPLCSLLRTRLATAVNLSGCAVSLFGALDSPCCDNCVFDTAAWYFIEFETLPLFLYFLPELLYANCTQ